MMRNPIHFALAAAAIMAVPIFAADEPGHDKPIPGPRGGRVFAVDGGHVEFLVQPDRKVSVAFYDNDMHVVPPGEQIVSAIAEAPAAKVKLAFEKTADAFRSTAELPEGDGYRIVLQIRSATERKPQNFRIDFRTEICSGCKRAEYACTCAHGS